MKIRADSLKPSHGMFLAILRLIKFSFYWLSICRMCTVVELWCVRACVRVCVCVRACVRACVRVCVCDFSTSLGGPVYT